MFRKCIYLESDYALKKKNEFNVYIEMIIKFFIMVDFFLDLF